MTDKEKEDIKRKIMESIKELRVEVERQESDYKPVAPDNAYGRLSRMEAIGSKAISDARLHDKIVTLQRLEYALSNCDSGRFGICTKCNNEILFARVMAVPYAALCINCAQKR